MSKSMGNVVDPLKLIEELGADILRLWVSSVDYRTDVSASDRIMSQLAGSLSARSATPAGLFSAISLTLTRIKTGSARKAR